MKTAVALESIESKESVRIFIESGVYRFVVSDNLETEDDAGVNLFCDVRFAGAQR